VITLGQIKSDNINRILITIAPAKNASKVKRKSFQCRSNAKLHLSILGSLEQYCLAISIDNDWLRFSKKKLFFYKTLFIEETLSIAKFYKNFKSVFMGFAFGGWTVAFRMTQKKEGFFSLILENPKMVALNRERQFKPSQLICSSRTRLRC